MPKSTPHHSTTAPQTLHDLVSSTMVYSDTPPSVSNKSNLSTGTEIHFPVLAKFMQALLKEV